MTDVAKDASFLDQTPILELHRNNLLNIEVNELLNETRCNLTPSDANVGWATYARDYVAMVTTIIHQMPAGKTTADPCPLSKANVAIQVPTQLKVEPIGSFGANSVGLTNQAGNANVLPTLDCVVMLPDSIWNSKDYLNHRYIDKRNLILWHLGKYLSQPKFQSIIGTVEWRFMNGDDQTPALLLTHPAVPKSTSTKQQKKKQKQLTKIRFQVQIIMGMESIQWIPSTRLFPNRANLKGDTPTPHYNALLARHANYTSVRNLTLNDHDLQSFSDALRLCQIWCLQRGFWNSHDGFGEMHLALLILYLYRTKRANSRMSPLQVLTVLCKFLTEWFNDTRSKDYMRVLVVPSGHHTEHQTVATCEHALLYAKHARESPINKTTGDPATLLECYQKFSDGPVLLDSTMMCNFFSNVSLSFCRAMGRHAKGTVEALHSHHRPFSYMFLSPARFWSCMDAYMRIPIQSIQLKLSKQWDLNADRGMFESITRGLLDVLGKALGDRIVDLRVLTTGNGNISDDKSDQIPTHAIGGLHHSGSDVSPIGEDTLVLGIKLNPDTCNRIVDRGPPADDILATQAFVDLWGKAAQLRRFKDGAIVHAVVWNNPQHEEDYVVFAGDDKAQGGVAERIIRHILKVHFTGEKEKTPQFCLRNILSAFDGMQSDDQEENLFSNSFTAHKNVMSAYDDLSKFLLQHSAQTLPVAGESDKKKARLGIPLPIDAVEPLSPVLRYSELFPPVPHPLLGGQRIAGKKVSGVVCSSPILLQIRFGRSSKWPPDIKAMGAAKTAMLVQLADGIEEMMNRNGNDGFGGPVYVGPGYLDVGFKGYSWRIVVRADPEIYLLRALHKPSPEALGLLRILTKEHVVAASHHSMMHAVHTSHSSSGTVVRMTKRWLAAHMLSDLIPLEVIDLLVAKVYSDQESPLDAPVTGIAGFMRVLYLLSNHNWARRPLVVDPQGHFSEDQISEISLQFEQSRGLDFLCGPPMYVISPNDRLRNASEDKEDEIIGAEQKSSKSKSVYSVWTPTFTQTHPERVTLSRAAALAKRSFDFMKMCLSGHEKDWTAIFRETTSSLMSYSALLRVDQDFVLDSETSSTVANLGMMVSSETQGRIETSYTRSMRARFLGPKQLRMKNYRNLQNGGDHSVLHQFTPIEIMVNELRKKFVHFALFFYNSLTPEVIAVLWRPTRFVGQPFSIMNSEFARPVDDEKWKSDSMVLDNMKDLMREMTTYTTDMIVSVKVLDDRSVNRRIISEQRVISTKRKPAVSESDESSDDSSMENGSD